MVTGRKRQRSSAPPATYQSVDHEVAIHEATGCGLGRSAADGRRQPARLPQGARSEPGSLRRGHRCTPHLHGRRGARRAQPDAEERGEDRRAVGGRGAGAAATQGLREGNGQPGLEFPRMSLTD